MAYELYQSRHKGYEIDNLLDDVVDLNTDVAALKTEYDANKVKMSDGTILPLHLVNTYATKTGVATDIATATNDMATNTSVASAIATATNDMATQTQVASDIATATTDMATNASVASAIAAAAYTLPEATTTTLGGVKPDGTTITVDSDGTIHSAGGGTGGGHTIVNTDGTAVAQEDKLQFKGLSVTDDSTNGITKVEGFGLNPDSIDDIASATPMVPAIAIGEASNYSTSEKKVGKWIDGKTIYQRTFNISNPSNATGYLDTSSANIESVITIFGMMKRNQVQWIIIGGRTEAPTSNNYGVVINYNSENGKIGYTVYGYAISEINNIYVTIQYTKVTD